MNAYGIREAQYGEYPQSVVDRHTFHRLEKNYRNEKLRVTGKQYITDSFHNSFLEEFQPRAHNEYEYNGKKYIRFVADEGCNGKVLSDGRKCRAGNIYWIAVEPLTWLIDDEKNIALSKQIIFAGIKFYDIKKFMDKYIYCLLPQKIRQDELENLSKELYDGLDTINDDTKDLLEKLNSLIIELPLQQREKIIRKRDALIKKYLEEAKQDKKINFDMFSTTAEIKLENKPLNPDLSLFIGLNDLIFALSSNMELVKRIKQVETYLGLFDEQVEELPDEALTKEDMIRTILFYANKYGKNKSMEFKDKLQESLIAYKERCVLELERVSLDNGSEVLLGDDYFDKDLCLMQEIMGILDKAVSYNKDVIACVDFLDRLRDSLNSDVQEKEDYDDVCSIVRQARTVIDSLEAKRKKKLEEELKSIINKKIASAIEILDNAEIIESDFVGILEKDIAQELRPFLIKLDEEANRYVLLSNINEQVSNGRRILEEKVVEKDKPIGIIDGFVIDIHNALLSGSYLEDDKEKAVAMVNGYLNKFSLSLENMTFNQLRAIDNFSYTRDNEHPLSILQNELAGMNFLLLFYDSQKENKGGKNVNNVIM